MADTLFSRDASNRLAFEMSRLPADRFAAICRAVAATFRLSQESEPVTNVCDLVVRGYRRGEQVIELAWDNWTGFSVCAKTPESEPLVLEIGAWLQQSEWATEG
jgi:hypothetical protein